MNTVCNKISFGKKNPTMCTPTAGFFQHLKLNDLKNLKIAYKKVLEAFTVLVHGSCTQCTSYILTRPITLIAITMLKQYNRSLNASVILKSNVQVLNAVLF